MFWQKIIIWPEGVSLLSQGALGPCPLEEAIPRGLGSWAPEVGSAASDSPFPTLEATAGEQVLGRHLHVDMPIGENADPVRNGFHSPESLQEQAPLKRAPLLDYGGLQLPPWRTIAGTSDLLGG